MAPWQRHVFERTHRHRSWVREVILVTDTSAIDARNNDRAFWLNHLVQRIHSDPFRESASFSILLMDSDLTRVVRRGGLFLQVTSDRRKYSERNS